VDVDYNAIRPALGTASPPDPTSAVMRRDGRDDGIAFAVAFAEAMPPVEAARAARDGVFVLLVAASEWRGWASPAYALLDTGERARVARKRRPQDHETHALAYAMHRLLLARVLGCAPADVALGRDALGCPRLRGDALRTSLSHGDDWLAFAVSEAAPVGIDIESAHRGAGLRDIAANVCHPRELDALRGLDRDAAADELLATWVRKEALLKAAGIGLQRDMHTFEAPPGQPLPLAGADGGVATIRGLDVGARPVAAAVAGTGAVAGGWLRPPAGRPA